jgi:CAAX protease family protein
MILGGGSSWVWALMWTPGAASIVARLILREGFADVSFRLGGRQGAKAIAIALVFPIVIGLISYGIAWTVGLVRFMPQPDALSAWFVGDTSPPILVFLINLALAATLGCGYQRSVRRAPRAAAHRRFCAPLRRGQL